MPLSSIHLFSPSSFEIGRLLGSTKLDKPNQTGKPNEKKFESQGVSSLKSADPNFALRQQVEKILAISDDRKMQLNILAEILVEELKKCIAFSGETKNNFSMLDKDLEKTSHEKIKILHKLEAKLKLNSDEIKSVINYARNKSENIIKSESLTPDQKLAIDQALNILYSLPNHQAIDSESFAVVQESAMRQLSSILEGLHNNKVLAPLSDSVKNTERLPPHADAKISSARDNETPVVANGSAYKNKNMERLQAAHTIFEQPRATPTDSFSTRRSTNDFASTGRTQSRSDDDPCCPALSCDNLRDTFVAVGAGTCVLPFVFMCLPITVGCNVKNLAVSAVTLTCYPFLCIFLPFCSATCWKTDLLNWIGNHETQTSTDPRRISSSQYA